MKKETKKAPEKKAIIPTPEKEKKAKVLKSQFMEVIVTAKKFGTYSKGDTIKMHRSTGESCIKNGVVKEK